MCDEDNRDDRHLQHYSSRASRPTQHSQPYAPVVVVINDSAGMRETVDAGPKFIRVGTSPILSPSDMLQARRRQQMWMADN